MSDQDKTRAQLISELEGLRERNAESEKTVAELESVRRELSAEKQRLELAVEGANVGLWDWNLETGEVFFGRRSAEILGLPPDEAAPLTINWQDLVYPEDLPVMMEVIHDHLDGKTPYYETEHRRRHKSGEWKWIMSRGQVVKRGPRGTPLRVTGIHLDITDRKLAEEGRRRSDLRFKILVETMNEGVTVLDREGNVVYVNNSMARMLGYSVQELIGRPAAEFFDEDNRKILREQLAQRKQGVDSATYEITFTGRDGRQIPVHASVSMLTNEKGEYAGSFGVVLDMTDKRKAERALRDSEERYRLLVETVNDGFGIVDENGIFTYVNKRFCEMLGYTKEEVIGRSSRDFHDSPGKKIHQKQFAARMHGEKNVYETVWVAKDGSKIPILLSASPVFDQEGTFKGSLAIGTDISPLKRIEEQLRTSLAEKEVLLREIHHRVKNNLQTMSSLMRIQSRHMRQAAGRKILQEAESRIRSMALVHERLHDADNLAEIEFRRYVESLVGFLSQSYEIPNRRIAVQTNVSEAAFGIDTAVPLGFILNELLSNCFKHAFPRGRKGKVTISLREVDQDQYQLSVQDNGVGMASRGNIDVPRALGLNLVNALARQLQGNVEIRNDSGTEVIVEFKPVET